MTILEVLLNAQANLANWNVTGMAMFASMAKEQLDNAIKAIELYGRGLNDEMPESEEEK